MAKFYKPLPDADPRAPAWARVVVTDGADSILRKIQANGWRVDMPDGVAVYSETGGVMQEAPKAKETKS